MNNSLENLLVAYVFGPVLYAIEGGRIDVIIKLTNFKYIHNIINENWRGLSPEIRINRWTCSICNEDYELCEHSYGEIYNGKKCAAFPKDTEGLATSLVKEPRDKRCRIEDLLIIYIKNSSKYFVWHGFKPNRVEKRFKHLQEAYDEKLITAEALHYFARYFSENLIGTANFPTSKTKFSLSLS